MARGSNRTALAAAAASLRSRFASCLRALAAICGVTSGTGVGAGAGAGVWVRAPQSIIATTGACAYMCVCAGDVRCVRGCVGRVFVNHLSSTGRRDLDLLLHVG